MRARKQIDTTLGDLIAAVSDAVSPLTHNRTNANVLVSYILIWSPRAGCGSKKIAYSSSPELIELNGSAAVGFAAGEKYSPKRNPMLKNENGKVGWILLWAIGVPVPVLMLLFLVRGCT